MEKFNQILRKEVKKYIEEEYPVLKYFHEFDEEDENFCIDFYSMKNSDGCYNMVGYDVGVGFFNEALSDYSDYQSFEIQVLNQYIIEILIEELIEKYPKYKKEARKIQEEARKDIEYVENLRELREFRNLSPSKFG